MDMSILSLGLNEKTKTPEAVVGQPEAGEGKRIELSREKFQQRGVEVLESATKKVGGFKKGLIDKFGSLVERMRGVSDTVKTGVKLYGENAKESAVTGVGMAFSASEIASAAKEKGTEIASAAKERGAQIIGQAEDKALAGLRAVLGGVDKAGRTVAEGLGDVAEFTVGLPALGYEAAVKKAKSVYGGIESKVVAAGNSFRLKYLNILEGLENSIHERRQKKGEAVKEKLVGIIQMRDGVLLAKANPEEVRALLAQLAAALR